jgi:type IX secretion system PorP/SprF family membrane protein
MKKLTLFLLVSISAVTYAQQMPQTTLYGYNMYAVNPAYAGLNNCTQIAISHLNQWVKVDGAPATSMINLSTSLGQRFGIGGQLLIDKIGMLQQFSGLGSLSYGMKFGEHRLRAGLSIGYNQYRLNPSTAIVFDPLDPIVNGGNQSAGAVNTDLGILYTFENIELAASTKQVLHTSSNFGYSNTTGYGLRRHFTGYAAYNIILTNKWDLKPSVFLKGINHVLQADINASATYNKFLNVGIGYRTQVGLIGRVGITLKDRYMFGYAYEAPMANMASYSSGSHELILKITLCRPEKAAKISKNKIDTIYREIHSVDTVFITKTEYKIDTLIIDNSVTKTIPETEVVSGSVSKTILFEFDKSLVKKESFGELESMVNLLQANPSFKLSLEGHTDATGAESYNVGLSKNRVNAVKDFLILNGINTDRIIIKHFGETQPKTSNDTPLGRKDNRRVDVMIIK